MGISPDVYQWTVATSVTQLRQFMSTLNVSSDSIELFIRSQSAQTTTSQSSSGSQTPAEESEVSYIRLHETIARETGKLHKVEITQKNYTNNKLRIEST